MSAPIGPKDNHMTLAIIGGLPAPVQKKDGKYFPLVGKKEGMILVEKSVEHAEKTAKLAAEQFKIPYYFEWNKVKKTNQADPSVCGEFAELKPMVTIYQTSGGWYPAVVFPEKIVLIKKDPYKETPLKGKEKEASKIALSMSKDGSLVWEPLLGVSLKIT